MTNCIDFLDGFDNTEFLAHKAVYNKLESIGMIAHCLFELSVVLAGNLVYKE